MKTEEEKVVTKRVRQSNMELLRVISMLAVVMVHLDGASLSLPKPTGDMWAVTARGWWILSVESVTIIGVKCFTLISGYFGIKVHLRRIMKFAMQCVFYSVLIYLVSAIVPVFSGGDVKFSLIDFGKSWLVFSHTDLWYVPAYLGLYLLSPFLNAGVESLSKRQFRYVLAAFILFNVWCGWLWGGKFNQNGYTVVQLVMMYLIGRYIGKYFLITDSNRQRVRRWALIAYVCATAVTAVLAVHIDSIHAFAYNSPLVLTSSVALFVAFATLRFHSRVVNWLALSSFAVYLIHKNPFVWVQGVRPLSRYMWSHCSLAEYTVAFIAVAVSIYLLSSLIDCLRRKLFTKLNM